MVELFNLAPAELAGRVACTVRHPAGARGLLSSHERYGEVVLAVEPYSGGDHLAIAWRVGFAPAADPAWSDGIPAEFRPAITAAIRAAAAEELSAEGKVIINIRVSVVGGRFHEVNSSAAAYRIAARRAFRAALDAAGLAALGEPMGLD